uniref:Reverse transcriptase domain-containing protein n=1 Tax=Steinernema glaseri TaxID=37863 RepID=A0A1I8AC84_9BILA
MAACLSRFVLRTPLSRFLISRPFVAALNWIVAAERKDVLRRTPRRCASFPFGAVANSLMCAALGWSQLNFEIAISDRAVLECGDLRRAYDRVEDFPLKTTSLAIPNSQIRLELIGCPID